MTKYKLIENNRNLNLEVTYTQVRLTTKDKTMQENLTQYGSEELTMRVMNEEWLYNLLLRAVSRGKISFLMETINEVFIYDSEQLEDLEEIFANELEEYETEL